MQRIIELGTTLAITSNCSTLGRNSNYMRKEAAERDRRGMSGGRGELIADIPAGSWSRWVWRGFGVEVK
jgi:hypothetical protein